MFLVPSPGVPGAGVRVAPMPAHPALTPSLSRRDLLRQCGMGMGAVALAGLLGDAGLLSAAARAADASGGINPLAPKPPPFPARAKRVVHFFLNGGPSHVDTFDPKPTLDRFAGKP